MAPQIKRASYDLNLQYGIDDIITGRTAVDLYDPLQLRDLCVLKVIYRRLIDAARDGTEGKDVLMRKMSAYKTELDEAMARANVLWLTKVGGREPSTSRFGMRMSR